MRADDGMRVDDEFVTRVVRELQRGGFPGTEGYYLVVLMPAEVVELRRNLVKDGVWFRRKYRHPPTALIESARVQGFDVVCVLEDALVVSADHTRVARPSKQPPPLGRQTTSKPSKGGHLRLVR